MFTQNETDEKISKYQDFESCKLKKISCKKIINSCYNTYNHSVDDIQKGKLTLLKPFFTLSFTIRFMHPTKRYLHLNKSVFNEELNNL